MTGGVSPSTSAARRARGPGGRDTGICAAAAGVLLLDQTDGTLLYGLYTTADLEKVSASAGGHRIFYVLTPDINSTDPAGNVVRWLEDHTRMDQAFRYGQGILLLRSG